MAEFEIPKNGQICWRELATGDLSAAKSFYTDLFGWNLAPSKVSTAMEQMVFAEATSVLPLLASDAWHRGAWRNREKRRFATLFD